MKVAKRTPAPLRRRAHVAEPERHFYVYCEGTKTEPEYLRNVGRRFKHARIVAVPVGGVPRTVAERAIERAKLLAQRRRPRQRTSSFEENDQVWAVIDRDKHPQFENVLAMCRVRRVKVAQSNPCFELWLVLHLDDFDKPIHSGGIQARLHELFPQYDHERSPAPDFEPLLDGMPEAEQRAARQLQARVAEQTPFGNPSTTVGHLTHAIREAHELARRRHTS